MTLGDRCKAAQEEFLYPGLKNPTVQQIPLWTGYARISLQVQLSLCGDLYLVSSPSLCLINSSQLQQIKVNITFKKLK